MSDKHKTYRINFVRYGWTDVSETSLEKAREVADEHAKKNPQHLQADTAWTQIEEYEIIKDEKQTHIPTKNEIYDTMCRVMTNYEDGRYPSKDFAFDDFYSLLVYIQNNWEDVITAQD